MSPTAPLTNAGRMRRAARAYAMQIRRWLAIAFTVTVIAALVALQHEKPVVWMSDMPLLPLALLLLTGLYLFVLPYATKWRSGRGIGWPKEENRA
jgi:uncharacterized membrane protein